MSSSALLLKLQKILSKTTEAGCTPAEAEAAMALASKIAQENNIELSQVTAASTSADPVIETERMDVSSTVADTLRPHHVPICHILAEVFSVRVIRMGQGIPRFAFIGEKTDVALAVYTWGWLDTLFPKLYLSYIKRIGLIRTPADNTVSRRSFYQGVSAGIVSANAKVQEAAKVEGGSSFALVLVNKAEVVEARVADEFPDLRKAKATRQSFHEGAWNSGREEGAKIKLGHGLGAGAKRESLL